MLTRTSCVKVYLPSIRPESRFFRRFSLWKRENEKEKKNQSSSSINFEENLSGETANTKCPVCYGYKCNQKTDVRCSNFRQLTGQWASCIWYNKSLLTLHCCGVIYHNVVESLNYLPTHHYVSLNDGMLFLVTTRIKREMSPAGVYPAIVFAVLPRKLLSHFLFETGPKVIPLCLTFDA